MATHDDAVREVHGVKAITRGEFLREVILRERDNEVNLEATAGVSLTPWQARYLAAKLYRLARRIKQRNEAMAEAMAATPIMREVSK